MHHTSQVTCTTIIQSAVKKVSNLTVLYDVCVHTWSSNFVLYCKVIFHLVDLAYGLYLLCSHVSVLWVAFTACLLYVRASPYTKICRPRSLYLQK